MQTTLQLHPRQRAGLVIAIIAGAIALNPLNRTFRIWLRDTVAGGVPYWADHLFFMMTLMVVVWGAVGGLILGYRGLFLGRPERPREAWLAGVGSGLGLTALVGAAIATLGPLVVEWHPNYPVMFANFASNFYEEFVFRGAILGLLILVLGDRHRWGAAVISALLFCQGHLQDPPVLLATVFAAGLGWAWMTLRYRSLWPAWVSHTVADTIADAIFRV
ncbi:MAG TPA: CPBP family intramembrane glutamic endopeptidase [Gemmatimonadales bacterium]|nr:CPBP family intramembrane glutamic endopeptidase [Gemmatimonadales bacterium]